MCTLNNTPVLRYSCNYESKGKNDIYNLKKRAKMMYSYSLQKKTHPTEPQRNNGTLWRPFLHKNFVEKLLDT
jgi:hypothetical protein